MRRLIIFLITFSFTQFYFAQTAPVNGDIVFTQIGSDPPDVIEFITLTRLNLTTLKITDEGILADGTLRTGEGTFDLSNTTWTDIPGGTFVRLGSNLVNDNNSSDRIIAYDGTGSGTLPNITINLDECIAYTGTTSSPTYIAGIIIGNATWNTGATSTENSKAPGTLSDCSLATLDNQYFNSTVDGNASTTRAAIILSSNWAGQSSAAIGYIDLTSKIGNSALPVELTSFTANVVDNSVVLNWQTATEVNNYGFEIARVIDNGKLTMDNWNKIGFVNGNGNSNSPKSYSYTDNNVISGKYNYRLKQIDVDGKFEYSNIVKVTIDTPDRFELLQNYPNPFNPSTQISFKLPFAAKINLSVFNVLGEKVYELENGFLEAGIHSINFNAKGLASGIYFYRLSSSNIVLINKMMLLK